MTASLSLRARLTAIILGPLLVIALGVGAWAWRDAQSRAAERFDLSLLSTALAISRDTAATGGDALREETRDLLRDTSGGPVFYHVYAPDGVFVTGYATPPVPPRPTDGEAPDQVYFDAVYRGQAVRALRFSEGMSVEGLTGPFTFTVWQSIAVRDGFVDSLTRRTSIVIATLVAALALIVWFGVRLGLRPLQDLEAAIARRSAADLSPIRRSIPEEVRGIVGTLNRLLTDLSDAMRAKDDFISSAAHQLRNPIAGVLSLAESLHRAPREADLRERSADIVAGARDLSRLAEGLLTLERAHATTGTMLADCDAAEMARALLPRLQADTAGRGVGLSEDIAPGPIPIRADPLLLEQAVLNVVTNALVHGGPELSQVDVVVTARDGRCRIAISDDGVGLDPAQVETALSRFGQVRPATGSGLGLPIAKAVIDAFGGEFDLIPGAPGLRVDITLPLSR